MSSPYYNFNFLCPKTIIWPYIRRLFDYRHGEMEDKKLQKNIIIAKKWLEDRSKGFGNKVQVIAFEGLQVLQIQKGFIRCKFVVTNRILDAEGNWHVGAMALLMDDVGAAAIATMAGHVKASLDYSISFFYTANIHEEVELEAKVIGDKGRIASVLIEVKRKGNGELIALGKQWMSSHKNADRAGKHSAQLRMRGGGSSIGSKL